MSNLGTVNFNVGEVTPKVDARSDLEKYSGACRRLENMLPLKFGGVEKRPGTEWISRDASFRTVVSDIISCENVGVCYDNTVVNTSYDNSLSQISCWENDIVCHENEVIVETSLMSRAHIVVCHENNVIFYDNDIVFYE